MSFKIVTWNINSIKVRLNHLREFIAEHNPDIICLQELKCETDKFPFEELSDLPYNVYTNCQKTYNGVAIFSKMPADEVIIEFSGNPIPGQARFIECSFDSPIGFIRVISLYAPNGGQVGSEKFAIKLDFYDAFISYIKSKKSFEEKLFIGADYNIAPYDIDVHFPDKLRDTTCFTLTEQRKLRTILNDGFVDNFRAKYPQKREYSWWDYRAGAFEQNNGMRIDTIISTTNALQNLEDCVIDYATREKRQPSDHAPVIGIYNQRT